MASFAPGTPQHVIAEYYRTAPPWLGGRGEGRRDPGGGSLIPPGYAPAPPGYAPAPPGYAPAPPGERDVRQGGPTRVSTTYTPPPPPVIGATPFEVAKADGYGRPSGPEPPPFQAIWGDPFGGTSDEPLFAQRDAFINNINEQMMPYYSGQATGAPRFDFQDAWDRGGEMVERGWQNPFAQTLGAVQQQSAPSMYAPAQAVETTSVRSGTPAPRQSVTTRTQTAASQPADPNRAQTLSSYSRSTARPTPIPAPGDARPSRDPYAYATGTGDSTSYNGMPAWFSGVQGRLASPQQRPAQTNKTGSVASRQLQSHASPR